MHDIAYDFYGTRLATCSSDKHITIFKQVPAADGAPGQWVPEPNGARPLSASVTGPRQVLVSLSAPAMIGTLEHAHKGPIRKLAWAHPQFGSIIASCSDDHKVIIWKEEVPHCIASRPWHASGITPDLIAARDRWVTERRTWFGSRSTSWWEKPSAVLSILAFRRQCTCVS